VTKTILVLAALAPAALLAQWPARSQFQQPGYVAGREAQSMGVEVYLPRGQGGPVLGRPLSATEVYHTTQVLSDGTHVDKSNTSQFYRDGLGRMRSESPMHVLIFDPVAGLTYELNTKQKTYLSTPIPAHTAIEWIAAVGNGTDVSSTSASLAGDPGASYAQRAASRSAVQQVTEELPPQNVDGVWAKGSRITITIPAGTFGNNRDVKVVNERWYSDDLKVLLKSSNNDPRYGLTTYELTQIVQAPPNPAVFQVPADYQLRLRR
jgi:hypothetical protein